MRRALSTLIEVPAYYCVVLAVAIVALTGLALFCDHARSIEADRADAAATAYDALVDQLLAQCTFTPKGAASCPDGVFQPMLVARAGR